MLGRPQYLVPGSLKLLVLVCRKTKRVNALKTDNA